jgi:hypothetical protein
VLHPNDAIDTVPLARRLLRDDADDCRLGTLAQRFQFDCQPTHRALADAQATVELLHLLIERATHYGAFDLDDLMRLPGLMRHPLRAKLATTAHLPRAPGVAQLLDRNGRSMHVVVADDLRHAVRRLFDRDDVHSEPPPTAVLRHLHRVVSVQTRSAVVSHVIALRWSATVPLHRGTAETAYLQHSAGSGRVRVVADRLAPDLIAGPMPRPRARQVVSLLASGRLEDTEWFVAALSTNAVVASRADADADADQTALADVVRCQQALSGALAFIGIVLVDGATVAVHDGRIRDVEIDGRSVAGDLPAVADDHLDCLPSAAHAAEAMFVAALLAGAQPGCEILDT